MMLVHQETTSLKVKDHHSSVLLHKLLQPLAADLADSHWGDLVPFTEIQWALRLQ